uniref:CC domain-containing protein n=1 Tax=Parastrongyloides trichosuri TaxID=131310 RepID=A0A0N4ZIS8_PARTI
MLRYIITLLLTVYIVNGQVQNYEEFEIGSAIGECEQGFCPRSYTCYENKCFRMLKAASLTPLGPCFDNRCPANYECQENKCYPSYEIRVANH